MSVKRQPLARIKINFESIITLNENEIRALDALVGYGDDAFLKVFYEKLGRGYMEKHEAGLKSFFENVRTNVIQALYQIDQVKKKIEDNIR